MKPFLLYNGQAADLGEVPDFPMDAFRTRVLEATANGARIASFFGYRDWKSKLRLLCVLTRDEDGALEALSTAAPERYSALTPECPLAHLFEREIHEQWGVVPEGHPWLKPVRFHRDARGSRPLPAVTDFFRMEGDEIHEVAVGPVHAGVIEPGHFRFQCHGETVHHLEIALGYQHRGSEELLRGGPDARSLTILETVAGDTSVGHALAYARVMEGLSGSGFDVPARAESLRGVALELERLANHMGDLGALAGDIGFLPTSSYSGRLRGDFLNMTALLCGNRFGRSLVRPGGLGFDLEEGRIAELSRRLEATLRDAAGAVDLLWDDPMVLGRFEGTGTVSRGTAAALGLMGPAARASGLVRDVRRDFPFSIYRFCHVPVSTWGSGDVFARAYVRWLEMQRSADFIREQLRNLPPGPVLADPGVPAGNRIVVSLTEGWRGGIVHTALTDREGRFLAYKIVDPSFKNWAGLAVALRGQAISDFPLCNKSFNLSYCGHDL